jgi:diadenosine tetraphosphate (Ap4A) HIT family hydrolase
MFFVAKKIAKDLWISEGYNLKFNVWEKGWQEVMHIHLHLLSNI